MNKQLDAAVRGQNVDLVKPADIKPLNLIDLDEMKKSYEKSKLSAKSSYPVTTSGMIGHTPTDPDTLRKMAYLQRHARPQSDFERTLGRPPCSD